ncbi:hypothetical protein ABW19_dt0204821 [Dactylella cylindrospora]|nr:hypothetical protein ABW19_dt0204821 [Dactylella cylindrospora]
MDDDYDSGEDIVAASNGSITTSNQLSRRKRKRAKREAEQLEIQSQAQATPAKKLKKSEPTIHSTTPSKAEGKAQKQKGKDTATKELSSIDPSIAVMDPKIMADFVAQRVQKFNKELSFVELGDRILPERLYIDTSTYTSERSLSNLCEYMEKFCTKKGQSSISHLKSSPKATGSPHTFLITPAALRAADLVRTLRKYQTADSSIAKFFAKHVKLSEAVEYSKKTRIGIAVGTPARLVDLIKDGALQIRYLQRVVLDVSYLDAKKRGLWDIKEIQEKVTELLGIDGVRKRLEGGGEEDSRGVMFY